MLIKIVEPDFIHEDERGRLTQLVHDGYKQYNIVFSKKGVLRGNHYHRENEEAFFVITGGFRLTAEKDGITEEYDFAEGDMFVIPHNVTHSFYYTEDTYLASMYTLGVEKENGEKDIFAE
ncbi:MAG: cupin domain-containing protein [Ruminiclostridium sp.]|nr:cupin domain-containing protein [Ruminiclostridium sp.]